MKPLPLCMAALLIAAGSARAVIPPLDDYDKLTQSTHIVEATVEKADRRSETDRIGTRWVTTLTVKIDLLLKGEGLAPGDTIDLLYWQAGKRPDRWVGDTGQRGSFAVGGKKRFFIHRSESGWHLLSPDGSESMESHPTFGYRQVAGKGWKSMIPADWSDEPAPSGKGTVLWPPEGAAPTMSHVSVEPYADACAPVPLREKMKGEVADYLDGAIVRELGGRPGEAYEIEYRWNDEPGQSFPFVNIDRFVCADGHGWHLRYATSGEERQSFAEAVQIVFRLFAPGKGK